MPPIDLRVALGDARAEALREVVEALPAAFPRRVRGYYMLGSVAEGTTVALCQVPAGG